VKKVKHKPPMLACPIIGILESDQDISKLNGRLKMITVSIWDIQKELHQEEVINLYHRGRELYDLHFRHTRIHRHRNLSKFKHNLGELEKQWHNTAKEIRKVDEKWHKGRFYDIQYWFTTQWPKADVKRGEINLELYLLGRSFSQEQSIILHACTSSAEDWKGSPCNIYELNPGTICKLRRHVWKCFSFIRGNNMNCN
jgi:hypothetical protein